MTTVAKSFRMFERRRYFTLNIEDYLAKLSTSLGKMVNAVAWRFVASHGNGQRVDMHVAYAKDHSKFLWTVAYLYAVLASIVTHGLLWTYQKRGYLTIKSLFEKLAGSEINNGLWHHHLQTALGCDSRLTHYA